MVGGQLLQMLLEDTYYAKVIAVTRRPIESKSDKLVNLLVDFDVLAEYSSEMVADDYFCCLGTTIKKAKTKEQFRKVDFHYPLELAKVGQKNNAQQYLLISALGADKEASVFYNRIKGEVEEAVCELAYKCMHIFRPALLMGSRKESRTGEDAAKSFFKIFGFLFVGPLKKYRAIDAQKVAKAMHDIAKQAIPGQHIHESLELQNY